MFDQTFATHSQHPSEPTGFVLKLKTWAAELIRRYRFRQTLHELEALDDDMLKDIGLNRGMLLRMAQTGQLATQLQHKLPKNRTI